MFSRQEASDIPSSTQVADRLAQRRKISAMTSVSSADSIERELSATDTVSDTTRFSQIMHNTPTNSQWQDVLEQIKEVNTKMDEVISQMNNQELHAKMDKVISWINGHCPLCTGLSHSTTDSIPSAPTRSLSRLDPGRSRQKGPFDQDFEDVEDVKQQGLARMYGNASGINIDLSPPAKPAVSSNAELHELAPVNADLVEMPARILYASSSSFSLQQIWRRSRNRGSMARIAWLYLEDPQLVSGGRMYHRIMTLLVVASCVSMTLQTVLSPPSFVDFSIKALEYAVDGIISIEIFLRFVVCPNRISFWIDVHNLLDILNGPLTLAARVTLRLVIEDAGGPQGIVSTVLNPCLAPVRLLKLLRRFEGAHLIYTALDRASETLPVLVYVLLVIITTFASILYMIEPRSNISSLPEAWWFAVVTLSTVGYGDVTPVTSQGKVVVGILIVMAALYMAMPLGIVGQIFADVWSDRTALMITELARRRFRIAGYTATDIPAMFYTFNKNRDGVLSIEEFTEMMKQMHFDTSGERAYELFNIFDSDGSGRIDDREFLSKLFPGSVADIYGTVECASNGRNAQRPFS